MKARHVIVGISQGAKLVGTNHLSNHRNGMVFDIAAYLGKLFVPLHCTSLMDGSEISRLLSGIVSLGAWCLFNKPENLSTNIAHMVATTVLKAQIAYRTFVKEIRIGRNNVPFCRPNFFFTSKNRIQFSSPAIEGFTPIECARPNFGLISELLLLSHGFRDARILSLKLVACLNAYGLEHQVRKLIERGAALLYEKKSCVRNFIADDPDYEPREIDEGAIISSVLKNFIPSSAAFIIDYFGGSMIIDKVSNNVLPANFTKEINRVVKLMEGTQGYERSILVASPINSGKTLAITKAASGLVRKDKEKSSMSDNVYPFYIDSYLTLSDLWGGMEETNRSTKEYKELQWSDGIIFKGLRRIVDLSRSNKENGLDRI